MTSEPGLELMLIGRGCRGGGECLGKGENLRKKHGRKWLILKGMIQEVHMAVHLTLLMEILELELIITLIHLAGNKGTQTKSTKNTTL